eukprot:m.105148 g.105148  ORF g.105148 m.105148 type:complete len:301 (-) comp18927_c1_seq1:216-1118(-)
MSALSEQRRETAGKERREGERGREERKQTGRKKQVTAENKVEGTQSRWRQPKEGKYGTEICSCQTGLGINERADLVANDRVQSRLLELDVKHTAGPLHFVQHIHHHRLLAIFQHKRHLPLAVLGVVRVVVELGAEIPSGVASSEANATPVALVQCVLGPHHVKGHHEQVLEHELGVGVVLRRHSDEPSLVLLCEDVLLQSVGNAIKVAVKVGLHVKAERRQHLLARQMQKVALLKHKAGTALGALVQLVASGFSTLKIAEANLELVFDVLIVRQWPHRVAWCEEFCLHCHAASRHACDLG